jgi:hypothetical protein
MKKIYISSLISLLFIFGCKSRIEKIDIENIDVNINFIDSSIDKAYENNSLDKSLNNLIIEYKSLINRPGINKNNLALYIGKLYSNLSSSGDKNLDSANYYLHNSLQKENINFYNFSELISLNFTEYNLVNKNKNKVDANANVIKNTIFIIDNAISYINKSNRKKSALIEINKLANQQLFKENVHLSNSQLKVLNIISKQLDDINKAELEANRINRIKQICGPYLDNNFNCQWRSVHRYLRLNSDGTYERGYWEEVEDVNGNFNKRFFYDQKGKFEVVDSKNVKLFKYFSSTDMTEEGSSNSDVIFYMDEFSLFGVKQLILNARLANGMLSDDEGMKFDF